MSASDPSSHRSHRRRGAPPPPALNAAATREADRGADIHICPDCDSDLVQPVEWAPIDGRRWRVELRCPECSWTDVGVFEQQVLDRYDRILDRGIEALQEDLLRFERGNMEGEIETFVSALGADLILPEDF